MFHSHITLLILYQNQKSESNRTKRASHRSNKCKLSTKQIQVIDRTNASYRPNKYK